MKNNKFYIIVECLQKIAKSKVIFISIISILAIGVAFENVVLAIISAFLFIFLAVVDTLNWKKILREE